MPPAIAIGRYSIAPAAAFATTGVMCALRWRGSTTGRARGLGRRAHRAEIPRIGHTVERDDERVGIAKELVEVGGPQRCGGRDHALRHVGACERIDAFGSTTFSAPPASSRISSIAGSSRTELDTDDAADRAPPGAQQLEHGPATFDLLTAQRFASRSVRVGHQPWRQTVPFGVSSSTMPRLSSSSRMRSAPA